METAITLYLKQCVTQQKIPFQYTIEDQKQLYIDWYNNRRTKEKLNVLSPVQYRKQEI